MIIGAVFAVLMFLLRDNMKINIAVSAAFVFAVFGMIWRYGNRMDELEDGK